MLSVKVEAREEQHNHKNSSRTKNDEELEDNAIDDDEENVLSINEVKNEEAEVEEDDCAGGA